MDALLAWLDTLYPWAVIAILLAAGLEYIFPPFPGDTIVLLGAFLVGNREWSLLLVFAAVNAGALLGMVLDYRFGRFIAGRDLEWRARSGWWRRIGRGIDELVPMFSRRAAFYLAANRFLPSIRGLFFVAAGMVQVPLAKVILYGGLSALCWNALLFAAGSAMGYNYEALVSLFSRYNTAAWSLLALLAAALALRAWRRRR